MAAAILVKTGTGSASSLCAAIDAASKCWLHRETSLGEQQPSPQRGDAPLPGPAGRKTLGREGFQPPRCSEVATIPDTPSRGGFQHSFPLAPPPPVQHGETLWTGNSLTELKASQDPWLTFQEGDHQPQALGLFRKQKNVSLGETQS